MNTERLKRELRVSRLLLRAALIVYAAMVVYPMLWAVLSSLKTNREFFLNIYGFPAVPQFSNYVRAWQNARIGIYFKNTVIITAGTLVLVTLLSSSTGYCLARIKFRLAGAITSLYVLGLIIPTMAGIVPLFLLMRRLSLLGSRFGLIVVYGVYGLPFSVFLLLGFFRTIPTEMEEAARIDGCSYFMTYLKVILPLARPGMVTVAIFQTLNAWNEFVLAFTFLKVRGKETLQVGLYSLQQVQYQRTDWATLFAGIVIVMLPTVVMYVFFSRRIQSGLTAGALKA